jgi:predicted SAM-dependent methyltransferase
MLNLGCGTVFHPAWENIDLAPSDPKVRRMDVIGGLPYSDNSFDIVYASHVLEHLPPHVVEAFLQEIRRVLSVGGIIRLVVPDLESIARAYLQALDDVRKGVPKAKLRHRWMTIEMLDQVSRQYPDGGEMVRFLLRNGEAGFAVAEERLGSELSGNANADDFPSKKQWILQAARDPLFSSEHIFKRRSGFSAYQIGHYRLSGEAHLWMYDAVSLGDLLEESGFTDVHACHPLQSAYEGFQSYNLDTSSDGVARKPDSLYMEGRKRAGEQPEILNTAPVS